MIKPTPTLAERLALAVCRGACPTGGPCPVEAICSDCRRDSAAVAYELAAFLRKRHSSSTTTPKPPIKPQPSGGQLIINNKPQEDS